MKLNVAFQTDELVSLNPERDTSLSLAQEAFRRGHHVFFFTPTNLELAVYNPSAPSLTALGREVSFNHKKPSTSPIEFDRGPFLVKNLSKFDVLFIRQDPPIDMNYLTNTYMLDLLPSTLQIINSPKALRNNPEKLLPFLFPDLMPPTLVSYNKEAILCFLKTHKKVVCKGLYNGAGRDIFLLREDDPNLFSLLNHLLETNDSPFLFQKFLPEIAQGDKRILLFNGKILGTFKRFPSGDFRANQALGGEVRPYDLSPQDHAILQRLIPFLQEQNILLAGIDLIGNYLTEINVTSPTGLSNLEKLYGTFPQKIIWQIIEDDLLPISHSSH